MTQDQTPPSESQHPAPAANAPQTGQPAAPVNRVLAYIVDGIITIPALVIVFIPVVGPIFAYAIVYGYLFTKDALPFLGGQSIGKKLLKIRVVSARTGKPITGDFRSTVIRALPFIIPVFPIVELIVLFTRPEKTRFGDDWAKTKVIVDK